MKKGALALTIILTAIGGLVIGVVVTFIVLGWPANRSAQQNVANIPNIVENKTVKQRDTNENKKEEIPDDWETYESDDYAVSFMYPPEWGAPTVDKLEGELDSLFGFAEEGLNFDLDLPETANGFRSVRVASLDDIEAQADPRDTRTPDTKKLLEVYNERKVGDEILVVPPVNAGVAASTDPTYIESADGSFRGMYFYSFSTQSAMPDDPAFLPELQIIMTDGETVVSFYRRSNFTQVPQFGGATIDPFDGEPEGTKKAAETCQSGQAQSIEPAFEAPKSCEIDSVLLGEFEDVYQLVASSLVSN